MLTRQATTERVTLQDLTPGFKFLLLVINIHFALDLISRNGIKN